jgi:hypothetical protein
MNENGIGYWSLYVLLLLRDNIFSRTRSNFAEK